ncbi:MAG: metal-dependent hydrolase [Candidatus Riflebacteria bacterium]|nr:metal-dependent hydrolase [Candidatus Riflebacteria bacterium]
MDIITQGLLGSAIATATGKPKNIKKKALAGFLIGLLPDADSFAGFFGRWANLDFHRSFTHSLPGTFLLAFLTAWLAKKLFKTEDMTYKDWLSISALVLMTHPLLDLLTSYGTEVLYPFTRERLSLDSVAIVDIFYSLPLLIITGLALFSRIAEPKLKKYAKYSLIISTFYLICGFSNSALAVRIGSKAFAEEGFVAEEIRALPELSTIKRFRLLGRDKDGNFMLSDTSVFENKVSSKPVKLLSEKNKYTEAVYNHKYGKLFKRFSMNMSRATTSVMKDGNIKVLLSDMRHANFAGRAGSIFAATFILTPDCEIISAELGNHS